MNSKKEDEKKDNNSIFSKENVNMGHQPELDYLKAVGAFEIVTTHVYMSYSFGVLTNVLNVSDTMITANSFMLLMGIGMKYSRHHEPKNFFSRGFALLTLGHWLNILRDGLPNLFAWWLTGNKIYISRALNILAGDILYFAGISFLFLGFMKKMKISDNLILIISIIMNIFACFLYQKMKSPNNFLLSQLFGYFILTKAEAYFPFCCYFNFVAFGYWLGGIYQKISNKDKFYNRILIFFLPIVLVFLYFTLRRDIPFFPQFNIQEIFFYYVLVGKFNSFSHFS